MFGDVGGREDYHAATVRPLHRHRPIVMRRCDNPSITVADPVLSGGKASVVLATDHQVANPGCSSARHRQPVLTHRTGGDSVGPGPVVEFAHGTRSPAIIRLV